MLLYTWMVVSPSSVGNKEAGYGTGKGVMYCGRAHLNAYTGAWTSVCTDSCIARLPNGFFPLLVREILFPPPI